MSYYLCLSCQELEFPPKTVSGGSTKDPRFALPSFSCGQVYSYHLPINAKRWIKVLQDLHYAKSFLGNQRHMWTQRVYWKRTEQELSFSKETFTKHYVLDVNVIEKHTDKNGQLLIRVDQNSGESRRLFLFFF